MWPGRARSSGCVAGSTSARTVSARSYAEVPVVTPRLASTVTVKAVPIGAVLSATIMLMRSSSRRSPGHGNADQAAPVLGHEVDGLGRHSVGRHDEIALVLPVLVVDDDDHLALADLVDRLRDRREPGSAPSPLGARS